MDRRTTLKWMMAVAAMPAVGSPGKPFEGYGTDPDLTKAYRAGELWPLTFDDEQRATAAVLCATIIPADERSPSAADVGVHHFIDEWISAPFPRHVEERALILEGLAWMDRESIRRFARPFREIDHAGRRAICDGICWAPSAAPEAAEAARFFARYRELTADGFYTTPQGMKDIGYVGNKAKAAFEGPPIEALQKAGLA